MRAGYEAQTLIGLLLYEGSQWCLHLPKKSHSLQDPDDWMGMCDMPVNDAVSLQTEHGAHSVPLLLTGGSQMCADDLLQCLLL